MNRNLHIMYQNVLSPIMRSCFDWDAHFLGFTVTSSVTANMLRVSTRHLVFARDGLQILTRYTKEYLARLPHLTRVNVAFKSTCRQVLPFRDNNFLAVHRLITTKAGSSQTDPATGKSKDVDDVSHFKEPISDDEFLARLNAAFPERMKVEQYEHDLVSNTIFMSLCSHSICTYNLRYTVHKMNLYNRTGDQTRSIDSKRKCRNVTRTQ